MQFSTPTQHCITIRMVKIYLSLQHGYVQDLHFYPLNEVDQPPMQTNEEIEMDVDGMEKNSRGKVDTTLIYKQRSRRMVKPSAILKSPFVDNCQQQLKKLIHKERLVANYVFENGKDEEYV